MVILKIVSSNYSYVHGQQSKTFETEQSAYWIRWYSIPFKQRITGAASWRKGVVQEQQRFKFAKKK